MAQDVQCRSELVLGDQGSGLGVPPWRAARLTGADVAVCHYETAGAFWVAPLFSAGVATLLHNQHLACADRIAGDNRRKATHCPVVSLSTREGAAHRSMQPIFWREGQVGMPRTCRQRKHVERAYQDRGGACGPGGALAVLPCLGFIPDCAPRGGRPVGRARRAIEVRQDLRVGFRGVATPDARCLTPGRGAQARWLASRAGMLDEKGNPPPGRVTRRG